jgi:hypothetical protein
MGRALELRRSSENSRIAEKCSGTERICPSQPRIATFSISLGRITGVLGLHLKIAMKIELGKDHSEMSKWNGF